MDFVVLDELGYLPFAQSDGQLLFHLVSCLYEQTSVIVTINLVFGEWSSRTLARRAARVKEDHVSDRISATHRGCVRTRFQQVCSPQQGASR